MITIRPTLIGKTVNNSNSNLAMDRISIHNRNSSPTMGKTAILNNSQAMGKTAIPNSLRNMNNPHIHNLTHMRNQTHTRNRNLLCMLHPIPMGQWHNSMLRVPRRVAMVLPLRVLYLA
jgi:hypothetical protein